LDLGYIVLHSNSHLLPEIFFELPQFDRRLSSHDPRLFWGKEGWRARSVTEEPVGVQRQTLISRPNPIILGVTDEGETNAIREAACCIEEILLIEAGRAVSSGASS
jgi:hypothetical protein